MYGGLASGPHRFGTCRTPSSEALGAVSYQYDAAGRRTRLTYPGTGLFVVYDWLLTGEVSKIRENGATTGIGVLATYGYDNLGRRTSLTRGNGTSVAYAFDAASRLTSLTENMAGTANDLTQSFAYNPFGGRFGSHPKTLFRLTPDRHQDLVEYEL